MSASLYEGDRVKVSEEVPAHAQYEEGGWVGVVEDVIDSQGYAIVVRGNGMEHAIDLKLLTKLWPLDDIFVHNSKLRYAESHLGDLRCKVRAAEEHEVTDKDYEYINVSIIEFEYEGEYTEEDQLIRDRIANDYGLWMPR